MTQQAVNSLMLYKGASVESIKKALSIQKSSIVEELKEYFNTSNIDELAIKLSQ